LSPLRIIGNVIWLLTFGLAMAMSLLVSGALMCLTIIGIPFGIQSFKLAVYAIWPFGSEIVQTTSTAPGCIGNGIWLVLGGLVSALLALILGVIACVTIIGIPFGLILFRMVPLIAWPFGKQVVPAGMASS
jgi:uncharacterized membrane protein YccF (DUF307 family)